MGYKKVATLDEIPDDGGLRIELNDEPFALFKYNGNVYAIGDTCSHAEASLSTGEKTGDRIKCPDHGAEFSIVTGEALTFPAVAPVQTREVKIEGNNVLINTDE